MTAPDYAALERDLDRAALEIELERRCLILLIRGALVLRSRIDWHKEALREPGREDERVWAYEKRG